MTSADTAQIVVRRCPRRGCRWCRYHHSAQSKSPRRLITACSIDTQTVYVSVQVNTAAIPAPHLVNTRYYPRLRENVARRLAAFRAQRDVRIYKEYYGHDWEEDKHDEKYAYAHEDRHNERARYEYEEAFEADNEEEHDEDVEETSQKPAPIGGSAPDDDAVLEEVPEGENLIPEEPLKTQAEWHALFHEALSRISTEKVNSISCTVFGRFLIHGPQNTELWLEPGQPKNFIFTRGDNWDKLSSEDVQAEVFYKTLYTNLVNMLIAIRL